MRKKNETAKQKGSGHAHQETEEESEAEVEVEGREGDDELNNDKLDEMYRFSKVFLLF